jgi:S1-C subfamily serine protease
MFQKLKTLVLLSLTVAISLSLSGCFATIFLPKKQKVTFTTNASDNEVYVNKEMVGKGKTFIAKVDKTEGAVNQVVIRKKDAKDVYDVILKKGRPIAFYPLAVLSIYPFIYPAIWDFANPKCVSFHSNYNFNPSPEESKLTNRTENDKYVNVNTISLNIQDKTKDLPYIYVDYDPANLKKNIQDSEAKAQKASDKQAIADKKAEERNKKKGKNTKRLEEDVEPNNLTSDDTKYTEEMYDLLKKTKFIDTVNKIFYNDNNTLVLDASIKKITTYEISNRWGKFYKGKVGITWYIKNTYNEIVDSIVTTEFSGNFKSISSYDYSSSTYSYEGWTKLIGDALTISYLKLGKNPIFVKNLKVIKTFKIEDASLSVNGPNAGEVITNKTEAFKGTVIVKTKEKGKDMGHGSGFAITRDGYILTNYHVVAGDNTKKQRDVTVILANGTEVPAKVVRFNRFKDVALLKIDAKFDKVFELTSKNTAEVMQDVYTIGAPKSIDLGQTVTVGIISNFRDYNDTKFIQLGMAINGGNSGGPVFDAQGKLHGIVVSKLVGFSTEGVGFAIPAYLVADYLNLSIR